MVESLQKEGEAVIRTAGATSTTGAEETTINAHATTTTRGLFPQGVDTTDVSIETLIGAEATATVVNALVLFVGQRGIRPSNAPKHYKQQSYPPRGC